MKNWNIVSNFVLTLVVMVIIAFIVKQHGDNITILSMIVTGLMGFMAGRMNK